MLKGKMTVNFVKKFDDEIFIDKMKVYFRVYNFLYKGLL
ncbi:Uncharacterised protein [Rodentibacter pneumotropicus]|uniref:Uncharacterized protein n=1 Tax=Rodentibacter pneumotropicus TaxID=758 RepID=A0A3S4XYX8_9PAST|nr:Uncharacterised protein [Rodentibacter pneumotropicus]